MFCCTLTTVAMRAVEVWSLAYSVRVSGDSIIVPTTKLRQVNLVFAWEVYFGLCVSGWGVVPSMVFARKVAMSSVGVHGVYMCAE